jgi:hypothetical protein
MERCVDVPQLCDVVGAQKIAQGTYHVQAIVAMLEKNIEVTLLKRDHVLT